MGHTQCCVQGLELSLLMGLEMAQPCWERGWAVSKVKYKSITWLSYSSPKYPTNFSMYIYT